MKNKRLITLLGSVCLILVLAALPFMAACAPEAPPAPAPPTPTPTPTAKPEYIVRVAYPYPGAGIPIFYSLENVFKPLVWEKSKGRIKVEIYPNAVLGTASENLDSMSTGALEMACLPIAVATAYEKPAAVGELPFLWKSHVQAWEGYETIIIPMLNEKLKEHNLVILPGVQDEGFKSILSNKHIATVDDLKGVKFRVQAAGIGPTWLEACGAKPIVTSWGEVFTGLEQGVIDAIELDIASAWGSKIYEVINYLAVTEHVGSFYGTFACLSWLNSLPDDVREIIVESMYITNDYQKVRHIRADVECLEKIEAEGGTEIIRLTAAEKAKFEAKMKTAYEWAASEYGENIIEQLVTFAK